MYDISITFEGKSKNISGGDPREAVTFDERSKKAVNCFDTFTFSLSPNNPGYDMIESMVTTVEASENGEQVFAGRVRSFTDDMNEDGRIMRTVSCESEMAYLCDVRVIDKRYVSGALSFMIFNELLEEYNKRADEDKQFAKGEVWTTGLREAVELEGETVWEAMRTIFIEKMGGELIVTEGRVLNFVEKSGEVSDTTIELSKNMKSVSRTRDMSGIVTRVIPLGAHMDTPLQVWQSRLTIKTAKANAAGVEYIENAALAAKFGAIYGVVVYDDVSDPDELYDRGLEYANSLGVPTDEYRISALDLSLIGLDPDGFKPGNTYAVSNPLIGIDEALRIYSVDKTAAKPWLPALTVGAAGTAYVGQNTRSDGASANSKIIYSGGLLNALYARLGGLSFKVLPEDDYSALAPKDDNTFYIVENNDDKTIDVYLGVKPLENGGGGSGEEKSKAEEFISGSLVTRDIYDQPSGGYGSGGNADEAVTPSENSVVQAKKYILSGGPDTFIYDLTLESVSFKNTEGLSGLYIFAYTYLKDILLRRECNFFETPCTWTVGEKKPVTAFRLGFIMTPTFKPENIADYKFSMRCYTTRTFYKLERREFVNKRIDVSSGELYGDETADCISFTEYLETPGDKTALTGYCGQWSLYYYDSGKKYLGYTNQTFIHSISGQAFAIPYKNAAYVRVSLRVGTAPGSDQRGVVLYSLQTPE